MRYWKALRTELLLPFCEPAAVSVDYVVSGFADETRAATCEKKRGTCGKIMRLMGEIECLHCL